MTGFALRPAAHSFAAALVALLCVASGGAWGQSEGETQQVVIVGTIPGLGNGGGGGVGGGAGKGGPSTYRTEPGSVVAALPKDPTVLPDARCNPLTTEATKTTTSRTDATNRFMAANQLFTAINARLGPSVAAKVIGRLPTARYGNELEPVFTVTYVDGGSEGWVVATALPATLIIEGNVPNSLKDGSGVPESCPGSASGG